MGHVKPGAAGGDDDAEAAHVGGPAASNELLRSLLKKLDPEGKSPDREIVRSPLGGFLIKLNFNTVSLISQSLFFT